jgi:hypothetical protein
MTNRLGATLALLLCACAPPAPAPAKYPTTQPEIDAAFERLSSDALRHAQMSQRRPRFFLLAAREAELALSLTGTWEQCMLPQGIRCISDSSAHQTTVESLKRLRASSVAVPPLPAVHWSLTSDATCKPLLDDLNAELGALKFEPNITPLEATLELRGCVFSLTPTAKRETTCQVVVGSREGGCGEVACSHPVNADKPCTAWSSTAQVSVDGSVRFATKTASFHHAWSEVTEHRLIDGVTTSGVSGVPQPQAPSLEALIHRTSGAGSTIGAGEGPLASATVLAAILNQAQPEERSVDCAQFPRQAVGNELDLGLRAQATAACPRLLP